MKTKQMKINLITLAIIAFFFAACSQSTEDKKSENADTTKTTQVAEKEAKFDVAVYYFHGDRRCETCVAVGDVAMKTITEKFGKDAKIVFQDINFDEEKNTALAEKYEVGGSSLLIVSGEKVEDLTTMAFQNAVSNPDSLSMTIASSIKTIKQ